MLVDENTKDGVKCHGIVFYTKTLTEEVEIPIVGVSFESREATKPYYLQYVHQQDFSICLCNSQRRGKGHDDFSVSNYAFAREGERTIQDLNEASQEN